MCQPCIDKLEDAFKFADKFQKLEAQFFSQARAQKSLNQTENQTKIASPDTNVSNKRMANENVGNPAKKRRGMAEEKESGGEAKDQGAKEGADQVEENEDSKAISDSWLAAAVKTVPEEPAETDENQPPSQAALGNMKELRVSLIQCEDVGPLLKTPKAEVPKEQHRFRGRASMRELYVKKEAKEEMRRHSVGSKGFICSFQGCGKVFTTKGAWNQHQPFHSGNLDVLLRFSA
jgi:hypothetical protein